jgi:hypothetical protein
MDIFIERIVAKKRDMKDNLISVGVILGSLLLFFILLNIPVVSQLISQLGLGIFIFAGLVYLCYRVIVSRNVEYEYILTNGDLDIDKITAKRKRKRIFSGSCKEFDILARVKSEEFKKAIYSIKNRIDASSTMLSNNAFFITANYKGMKTMVIFEPDERMLNNFKIFIQKKMLLN